jgi:hypothetical protein
MKKDSYPYRWEHGSVDPAQDHIVLTYGDINKEDPKEFPHVALVSAPKGFIFKVQFLVDDKDDRFRRMRRAVEKELNFYLVEKLEPDPWAYAIYHCNTAANLYSKVHWLYFPKK